MPQHLDTLRLSKRLHAAGMDAKQADILTETPAECLRASADADQPRRDAELECRFTRQLFFTFHALLAIMLFLYVLSSI